MEVFVDKSFTNQLVREAGIREIWKLRVSGQQRLTDPAKINQK